MARCPVFRSTEKSLGAVDLTRVHAWLIGPLKFCRLPVERKVRMRVHVHSVCLRMLCRYRSIVDRLLRMRLVPAQRLTQRDVSYEFMNRQMVWHAFTVCTCLFLYCGSWPADEATQEFLLFLLPLINTRALSRRLSQLWSRTTFASFLPASVRSLAGVNASSDEHVAKTLRGKYWSLSMDQCAICFEDASSNLNLGEAHNALTSLTTYQNTPSSMTEPPETAGPDDEPPPHPIHTPYVTDCGHRYCYVCVTTRMLRTAEDASGVGPGGTRWECLRCGQPVSSADRVDVDAAVSEFGYMSGDDMSYGSENMDFSDFSGSVRDDSDSEHSE